ncbi:MAG: hypothetical protein ACK4KV_23900 [Rhodocyclaceae bacterium]
MKWPSLGDFGWPPGAKSAALQLGKALEDPERGLTALTRAGVSFSEAEQEMIKGLVESGRLLEAQGIILDKVAGQVGGVAREMAGGLAGAMDTVSQRAEEVRVRLGAAMQPGLIVIANQISGALEGLADNLDNIATLAEIAGSVAVAALAGKAVLAARAYAASINIATTSTIALTVATNGLAAAGKGAFATGKLVAAAWPVAVFAGAAYAMAKLSGGLDELRRDAEALADAEESLADTQARSAERFREISAETGVVVRNIRELTLAVDSGRIAWDAAAGTWVRVRSAMESISASSPRPALEAVRQEMELLAARGPETAAALERIMKSADIGSSDGIKALVADLDLLQQSVLATGEQIDTALRKRLESLTTKELQEFRIQAEIAFSGAADAAERLAQVNDGILAVSLAKLGINAAAALGTISPAAQEAIDAVDGIAVSLAQAGVSAERSALVIEQALSSAFSSADSLPALDALDARLQQMARSGHIGADAQARLGAEVQKARQRIEASVPGVTKVTKELERNAAQSEETRKKIAALRKEYEQFMAAGDLQGAAGVQQQIDALKGLGDQSEQTSEQVKDAGEKGAEAGKGIQQAGSSASATAGEMKNLGGVSEVVKKQFEGAMSAIGALSSEAEKAAREAYSSARSFEDFSSKIDGLAASASRFIGFDQTTAQIEEFRDAADTAREAAKKLEEQAQFKGHGWKQFDEALASMSRFEAALNDASAAALVAERRVEGLDKEISRLGSSRARGLEDLELRLLSINGTEEEIAKARARRESAELEMERKKLQLEIQRAQLRGEYDEVSFLQQEIKLLNEYSTLLAKVHSEEEKARAKARKEREREKRDRERERGGSSSGGGGGGTTSTTTRPDVTTNNVTNNTPIHIHGITDPLALVPAIEKALDKRARLRK